MPYQGVALFFFLGVGIATAALMYLLQERLEQPYANTGSRDYGDNQRNRPRPAQPPTSNRRRRRPSPQGGPPQICTICQYLSPEGPQHQILRCGHGFHKLCIEQWEKVKRECPTCRESY